MLVALYPNLSHDIAMLTFGVILGILIHAIIEE